MRLSFNFNTGFTLTELLVGLGILGLIAAFAVPKVLNASGAALANAKVHKGAQAVVQGFEKWTQENGKNPTTSVQNIMSMVQHNGQITDGRFVDWAPTGYDQLQCVASIGSDTDALCYQMPDASVVMFVKHHSAGTGTDLSFSQTGLNMLYFGVDPDGIDGPTEKSALGITTGFFLYYNGRLRERGHVKGNMAGPDRNSDITPDYYQQ
jgi:prepilin-type N-terminal cleavage/methylation domain-containing protein